MTVIELVMMLSLLTGLISGAVSGGASGGLWFVPGAVIGAGVGFGLGLLATILMAGLTAFMLWWTGEIKTLQNPEPEPAPADTPQPPPVERSRGAKLRDDALGVLVLVVIVGLLSGVWMLARAAAFRVVGPRPAAQSTERPTNAESASRARNRAGESASMTLNRGRSNRSNGPRPATPGRSANAAR